MKYIAHFTIYVIRSMVFLAIWYGIHPYAEEIISNDLVAVFSSLVTALLIGWLYELITITLWRRGNNVNYMSNTMLKKRFLSTILIIYSPILSVFSFGFAVTSYILQFERAKAGADIVSVSLFLGISVVLALVFFSAVVHHLIRFTFKFPPQSTGEKLETVLSAAYVLSASTVLIIQLGFIASLKF